MILTGIYSMVPKDKLHPNVKLLKLPLNNS